MIDRKEYISNYHKEKLKRVPLDLQKNEYETIKSHALKRNESVNGFIKRAIRTQMERDKSE